MTAVGVRGPGRARPFLISDHEPGPMRGKRRSIRKTAPPERSASAGGAAVRAREPLEDLARGVGDHEPRRDVGRDQRAHHRAGRGADDVVGAARVPAGLARERLEPARQPRAAHDAARPQYESDLHSA